MNDLIPPSQPVPQTRGTSQPSLDADREAFWGQAPEIEFRAVHRGPGKARIFAASAGALLLTLGIGWAAADKVAGYFGPPAPDPAAIKAAEALNAAQAQRQELAALRVHVETLKSKLDAQAQKSRAAESTIASLQKGLAEEKADAASAASQLQAKIEKIQSQAAEKAVERNVDKAPTASIGKPLPRPPQNPANIQVATPVPAPVVRPAPYRAFVLRDVGPGRALVEGGGRIEEVEPGDILPGGAMVERIERRGQNWIVMTDRGYIGPDFDWDN
ncbi:MAG: hypothetical protein P4L77_08495 [Sulfuriferula sp.]|nr:hypothetical protein [Sulfuriferula sp.]